MKSFSEQCIEAIMPYTQEDKHDAKKAVDAILELIKGIVPEERIGLNETWGTGAIPGIRDGWNACREQFLERLK